MIFTHFAPNETFSDSYESLKILTRPWSWRKGRYLGKLKSRLKRRFVPDSSSISLFLSGRSGLYHTLKALRLPSDTCVLVQAFTCEAVILPILELKLKPIYIDIEIESFSMNIDSLKTRLSKNPNCKVIILQHTFGMTPQYRNEILELAKALKCFVIEDVAHGFDESLFRNKALTTTLLLSMGRSKPFSAFFGGAVITKNKKIIASLGDIEKKLTFPSLTFLLRAIGYKIWMPLIKSLYPFFIGKLIYASMRNMQIAMPEISAREKKGHFDESYLKALPDAFAHFAVHQLKRYNEVIRRRSQLTDYYNNVFHKSYNGALLVYPLLVKEQDKTFAQMRKQGIYLGTWYTQVIGPHGIPLKQLQYETGSCPRAEYVSQHIVNLPTNINKNDAKRIAQLLENSICD